METQTTLADYAQIVLGQIVNTSSDEPVMAWEVVQAQVVETAVEIVSEEEFDAYLTEFLDNL